MDSCTPRYAVLADAARDDLGVPTQRAFANVEYLATSVHTLLSLADYSYGQQLRCAMAHVTDEVEDDADCDALRRMLAACTDLHILLSLGYLGAADVRQLLAPRTTHLIIDPVVPSNLQSAGARTLLD